MPDNRVAQALLEELGEPMMSSTLILPGNELPETEPDEIREKLAREVDLIVDGGHCGFEPTSVLSIGSDGDIEIVRRGRGDVAFLD